MLVEQILKSKSDMGVVSVEPDSTVADAARLLSSRKIGTVIVSKDGRTAQGILSERDIVREVGKRGHTCLNEKVEDMMTRNLETCANGDRADEVLMRMTAGRFRHMPVIEKGEMIGLISIGDVVNARLQELAMEKDALEGMIMGY